MPQTSPAKLTYEDLLRLPDDGKRHELIGGVHYVTASPVLRHQRVLVRLVSQLHAWVDEHDLGEAYLGPTDIVLSRHDLVVPDLLFVSRRRAHVLTDANLQGAPDLVVEILSPSTRRRDEELKRELYERTGVAEYWIVDAEAATVRVLRAGTEGAFQREFLLDGPHAILRSPLLPGLEIPLARLFRR